VSVNTALPPTPERHGRRLTDTARAQTRHGRADEAAHAVLAAHRHAPEEVDRASVGDLVTLLYSPTPTPTALRRLAGRVGVRRPERLTGLLRRCVAEQHRTLILTALVSIVDVFSNIHDHAKVACCPQCTDWSEPNPQLIGPAG